MQPLSTQGPQRSLVDLSPRSLSPRRLLSVVRLFSTATLFLAIVAVVSAQRRGGPPEGAGAPSVKPYVPVPTTELAKNPDQYIGENVTLTASVEKVLSKSVFSIDQRVKNAPAGNEVLVIAPILNGPVEPNKYVTVAGELVKFDPDEIAKKVKGYRIDLSPDLVEQYRGRPAVIAKVVVNDKMTDLAMRLPPAYTDGEKALDDTMKKVGPAAAALRTAVDGSKADVTSQNLAVLKQAFAQTESFWKSKNVPEAAKIAQTARGHVDAVEKAAAAGDWDAAKKSAASLQQTCGACHNTYRERFDDGSFRMKVPDKKPT
jgi:soluble cytochrome b562